MFFDDAYYYANRAVSQLGLAANAADDTIAGVHARLSDMYLERARSAVGYEAHVGLDGNVVPLRISA